MTKETIIQKAEVIKRGFGSATAALFQDVNGTWDYVEVIHKSDGDRQSSCHAVDEDYLIGMTIGEIQEEYQILRGKWHTPVISEEGEILRLTC